MALTSHDELPDMCVCLCLCLCLVDPHRLKLMILSLRLKVVRSSLAKIDLCRPGRSPCAKIHSCFGVSYSELHSCVCACCMKTSILMHFVFL